MSFDDDAAGDGAGYRPPPHPDDRLWRHPSEISGGRQVGLAPQPRPPWPWGVVAVVGTATVLLAGAGALVLGFRDAGGGGEVSQRVETTVAVAPGVPPPKSWLGIEGLDQPGTTAADEQETTEPPDDEVTDTSTTTTVAGDDGTHSDEPVAPRDEVDPDDDTVTSSEEPPTTPPMTTVVSQGVLVTSVDPDGPVAGVLKPGDVVLEVDGQPVTDMDALLSALAAYEPGDQVAITYVPDGGDPSAPITVMVTLAQRPASLSASAPTDE